MNRIPLILTFALSPAWAQFAPPNDAGVAMGHLHLTVRDIGAGRKFWIDGLGGKPAARQGNNEVIHFPGVLVLLRQAEFAGGSDGSAINHLGFKVKDLKASLERCRAVGVKVTSENPASHQAFLVTPEDVRVELTEDTAMDAPVAHHHVHFATQSVDAAKVWYVNTFGAVGGRRGRFEAADVPGANLSFSPSDKPLAPTKGRSLDHIGFEVKDLEAFTKKLAGMGVVFDVPYRKVPSLGIAIAFFTDPFGTYIELTEGLGKW